MSRGSIEAEFEADGGGGELNFQRGFFFWGRDEIVACHKRGLGEF